MSFPRPAFSARAAARLAACVGAFAAVSAARAAGVSVLVTDTAGTPLADAVVMLEPAGPHAPPRPLQGVQIAQHDQQFDPPLTVVTVGTPVLFPNNDTVKHHVYSFSPAKTFQIKLYSGVPHTPIVFDKPGVAVLGCNIHDPMVAWVVVTDTPYYARTGAGGRLRIEGVPAGAYQMRTWHSRSPDNAQPLVVGAVDVEQRVSLGLAAVVK
jgi:plastocyanin